MTSQYSVSQSKRRRIIITTFHSHVKQDAMRKRVWYGVVAMSRKRAG